MEKKKLLIAFSGGRTSAFMTQWLIKNKSDEYEIIVGFANTGKENEETLQFVQKCDEYFGLNVRWVEAVVNETKGIGIRHKEVDFETASRNGEPFEAVIKKYGIPNSGGALCSTLLKKRVMDDFKKKIGFNKCYTAIGIRTDEIDRMSQHREKERIIYPLIKMIPTNKHDVNLYWKNMPFDLGLKSYQGNCDCCWKKSFRNLMTIAVENPEKFEWWQKMQDRYENTLSENEKIKGKKLRFYRGNRTVQDILDMSKKPFNMAIDLSYDIPKYKQAQFFDENLDVSNGCEESCEAY
jgi:hypothetical protein